MTDNCLLAHVDAHWRPLYHSSPLTVEVDGETVTNWRSSLDWVADWTPQFLKSYSDFQPVGSMFSLTAWQAWVVQSSAELNADGFWRYRRYLLEVARKNGKTEIAALLVLSHLITAPDYAEIYSAAVDRQQARLCFDKVQRWIAETPALADMFKIQESKSVITNKLTGATYRALAADASSAQGLNPYFIVMDELHVWDDGGSRSASSARKFYAALVTAAGARRQSQVFIISTAGENVDDTLLGDIYKEAKKIAAGEIDDDSFGFAIWEVPETADPLDEANWVLASPNLAEGFMSIDFFRSKLKEFVNTNINEFFRYFLNQWVRTTGEGFISKYHWGQALKAGERIPAGAKVVAGFDGSKNEDSTALVVMDVETGLFTTWGLWEKDYDDENWLVDRDAVKDSFLSMIDTYDVIEVRVDGTYWKYDLMKWSKEWKIPFQEFPQSAERLINVGKEFRHDLVEGNVFHNGEAELTRHVMNAVTTVEGKPAKEDRHSRHKIDLLMAAAFANNARIFYQERKKRKPKVKRAIIGF